MPFKYEINGQVIEFDKEPTTEDIDYVGSQLNQEPIAKGFTLSNFPDITRKEPSPTSFKQDLMLSFLPNDETRIQYLSNEFKGANIDFDMERGILINGVPVNPKGFDLGDISRSAGYTLPFMGQIIGGLVGGATGSTLGPIGAIAGGFTGGVSGATFGEGIRLAIPELLGLDLDGKDVYNSLAEQAKYAAIGETIGLGLIGAGTIAKPALKRVGETKALLGLSNLWQKTMKKLGKEAPVFAQFLGGVNPSATRIAMREGYEKTLNIEFFNPQKTSNIVKNTLFGTTAVDEQSLFNGLYKNLPITNGTYRLAQSIEEIPDQSFRNFLTNIMGISGETQQSIVKNGVKNIVVKENFSNFRGYEIAEDIIKQSTKMSKELGEELAKKRLSILAEKGADNFWVKDLGENIDNILQQTNLIRGMKVKGFRIQPALGIKGKESLLKLRNLFRAEKVKTGEIKYFDKVSLNQASRINQKLDYLVDEIALNKRIPNSIKMAAYEIADVFRKRFDTRLELSSLNKQFSIFKEITDAIKLDRSGATARIENMVKSFRTLSGTTRTQLDDLLSSLPGRNKLYNEIDLLNTAHDLMKVNAKSVAETFQGQLTAKELLDLNKATLTENYLNNIDNALSRIAPRRQFFTEAQKSLAAKEFLKGTPNILRLSTVAGMVGIGGLLRGWQGGLLTLPLALKVTNPPSIAKFLVAIEKQVPQKFIKNILNKITQPLSTVSESTGQSILKALLTQKLRMD